MSPAKPDDLLILKVHKLIKNQKATPFGLLDSHDSATSPAFSFRTPPRKQSHYERASSWSAAESQETLETEDSPMSAIKVLEDGRAKRSYNECNAMPLPKSPQKSMKKARF